MFDLGGTNGGEVCDETNRNFEPKREIKSVKDELSIKDFVNYSQAAKLLGKTKNAIKLLVKREKLTPIRIGSTNYLVRNDVLKYKSYGRKKKSDTLSERGDISSNFCDCKNYSQSDTLSERGDIFVSPYEEVSSPKPSSNPANSFATSVKVNTTFNQEISALPAGFLPSSSKSKKLPLTVPQVAEKLNCSSRHVIDLINEDKIKATRVGRSWLVSEANFQAFYAVIEERHAEERAYQEKLADHARYVERFNQLPYTDKLLEKLFSPRGGQWEKDLIKQTIAQFLRGSLFGLGQNDELEIAKIAAVTKITGIREILPDNVDLFEMEIVMQKRLIFLRDGSYLKQYAKYQNERPDVFQRIRIASSNVNYYQDVLNQIEKHTNPFI